MSAVDTSPAEVERMAAIFDERAAAIQRHRQQFGHTEQNAALRDHALHTAALLRALAARAERAEAERDAAVRDAAAREAAAAMAERGAIAATLEAQAEEERKLADAAAPGGMLASACYNEARHLSRQARNIRARPAPAGGDALAEMLKAAERRGIERAAALVDARWSTMPGIAAAIRALIEEPSRDAE